MHLLQVISEYGTQVSSRTVTCAEDVY